MRKAATIILLVFIFIGYSAAAQKLPSFDEVISTFFKKYAVQQENTYILFEKKQDGWFVVEGHYGDAFTTNSQQFWSTKSNDYVSLNYPLSTNVDSATLSKYVNDYLTNIAPGFEQYGFQRNRYYGYPGWDWDVINSSSIENANQDTLLESLGRAYSTYASGFLIEQYGNHFTNNDSDRIILPDSAEISSSRIKKFIQFEKKSWEAYEKLKKINPDYQTTVGDVGIKLANEHLFMYSDLEMAGDMADAIKVLENVHYPDSLIYMSKSILDGVEKNGILLSFGDNVTYSLWYLQQKEGYRKDVSVINTTLLGLRRYVKMLDDTSKRKLFLTKQDAYLKKNFDYAVYVDFALAIPVEAADFIDKMNHYNFSDTAINNEPYIVYQGEKIKRYYTSQLFFVKPGTKSITENMNNIISLPKSVLMMDQFMMIDVVNTNFGKRPIYFTYEEPLFTNLLSVNDNGYLFLLK
jgi:hypothetical protein